MPVETIGAQHNQFEEARERLDFGSAPSWICPRSFRSDFKAKQPGHQTHLLVDRQFHAEERQTFVHAAIRLETLQGVHRHSQWRLEFEPQAQSVTIHSITTHRGAQQLNHAHPEKFHIVHREAGEEHLDIEAVAVVAQLEDIRPGDILEWSYTLHERSPLLAEYATAMFTAPAATPIGCFHFAVRFNPSRAMKWKSSTPDLMPEETSEGGESIWTWTRENHPGTWPEENTPDWFIDYPWAQVSDCPDWETISTALAANWKDDPSDGSLTQITQKIARDHNNTHSQIEAAIQMVQDEFRSVPTDYASMLQPPAAPAVVERRRFGESKDLAFLLARLLQGLQITARPMLVNRIWRRSLSALLPMPLFDHAVVEYQVRGETRWVDPAAKRQGGGALNRIISDYGAGLPVAPSSRLARAPELAAETSVYELKELLLLDTSGSPSWLGVTVTSRGVHAEELRREFEAEGAAGIARRRLQQCAARFNNAKRIGVMEFNDDRSANVFVLAEGFEISGFLSDDAKPSLCKLSVPNDFLFSALKMPEAETRRTPFAVPYPLNIAHTIEVHCLSLPPGIVQTRNIDSEFLHFSRFRKTLAGDWTTKFTLSTLTDTIPAEQIDEYRSRLRDLRTEATWSMLAPVGQGRPHQRSDFGKLPNAWQQAAQDSGPAVALPFRPQERTAAVAAPTLPAARVSESKRPAGASTHTRQTNGAAAAADSGQAAVRYKRRKRHRRHRRTEKKFTLRNVLLTCAAAGLAVLFVYLFIRGDGPSLPTVEPPAQETH